MEQDQKVFVKIHLGLLFDLYQLFVYLLTLAALFLKNHPYYSDLIKLNESKSISQINIPAICLLYITALGICPLGLNPRVVKKLMICKQLSGHHVINVLTPLILVFTHFTALEIALCT